jgi:DNA-binding winged helix-turn-helix (wHTH) protein
MDCPFNRANHLLIYLVENRDRVVCKDDLIETIWQGRIVSESTLTSRINAARKAVGDSGKVQAVIRTRAKKGFRFVGEVSANVTPQDPAAASSQPQIAQPEIFRPTEATNVAQPPLERPAIAVLPFTGEPGKDYFSEGISEDIITALSKLRWFYVIAQFLLRLQGQGGASEADRRGARRRLCRPGQRTQGWRPYTNYRTAE